MDVGRDVSVSRRRGTFWGTRGRETHQDDVVRMAGLIARLEQVDRDLTIVGDLDRVAAVFEQSDGELLIHLVVLSEKDVELDLLGLVGWQRGVRFESRKERARAEGSNSRSAAVVLFDAELADVQLLEGCRGRAVRRYAHVKAALDRNRWKDLVRRSCKVEEAPTVVCQVDERWKRLLGFDRL
jgi:hypothetical protein